MAISGSWEGSSLTSALSITPCLASRYLPNGLAFLAKHGHFVKMPDAAIRDKSKADMLVKSLVCIQVGWMLVQTVSRKIAGYPITLLEVHTLVHVACAISMYGLWFEKPLDVQDPAWVDASEFEDLLALMLVRNYGFGTRIRTRDQERPAPIKSVSMNLRTDQRAHIFTSTLHLRKRTLQTMPCKRSHYLLQTVPCKRMYHTFRQQTYLRSSYST